MGSCSVHHFWASASAGCCAADEVPRQLPAGPQGEACIRAGQVLPVHDAHPAAWRDSRQPAVACHGYTGRPGVLEQIVESQTAPGVLLSKATGGWLYTGALHMKQRDGSAWPSRCMHTWSSHALRMSCTAQSLQGSMAGQPFLSSSAPCTLPFAQLLCSSAALPPMLSASAHLGLDTPPTQPKAWHPSD